MKSIIREIWQDKINPSVDVDNLPTYKYILFKTVKAQYQKFCAFYIK